MQAADRIEILQALPIFGGINTHSIKFLLERSQTRNVPKAEYFFHEGDEAESLFVLEQGSANLFKTQNGKEYFLRQIDQGDCFGEVAIMDLMPRSASVRASTDCNAIELSRMALYELYQEDLEQFTMIQMNMGREVSRRLRQADQRLFDALCLNPVQQD